MVITHRLLWSNRNEDARKIVLDECKRVSGLGGSFQVEDKWWCDEWYSFITINYPEVHHG